MTVMAEVATAAATSSGPRDCNEDRVVTWTSSTGDAALAAVADGMGGQAGGAVASQLAADGVREWLATAVSSELDAGWLTGAIDAMNERIRTRAATPGLGGMGTTLAAILATPSEVLIANIGDSRCYCVGATGIEPLTEDHSVTADAIRRGLLTPEKAVNHPYAHALTRALGTDAVAEPDITTHPWPELGAVYIACSDGVWNVLSGQDLDALVRHGESLQTSADAIVSAAVAAGTNDNASVALLEIGRLPRTEASAHATDLALQPTIRLVRPRERRRRLRWLLLIPLTLATGAALAFWGERLGLSRHGRPARVAVPGAGVALPPPPAALRRIVVALDGRDSARASVRGAELGWVRQGAPLLLQARDGEIVQLQRFPSGMRDSFRVAPGGPDTVRLPRMARSPR